MPKAFLASLKYALINFLRGQAVKLALKKLLGSSSAGGFKAWLVKLIVTEFYDEIGEPVIKLAFRKAGYIYNKIDGEIKIKKLREAHSENDEDAYDDIVTDILS